VKIKANKTKEKKCKVKYKIKGKKFYIFSFFHFSFQMFDTSALAKMTVTLEILVKFRRNAQILISLSKIFRRNRIGGRIVVIPREIRFWLCWRVKPPGASSWNRRFQKENQQLFWRSRFSWRAMKFARLIQMIRAARFRRIARWQNIFTDPSKNIEAHNASEKRWFPQMFSLWIGENVASSAAALWIDGDHLIKKGRKSVLTDSHRI